jgi:hypothetical protein
MMAENFYRIPRVQRDATDILQVCEHLTDGMYSGNPAA